jgi:hypothetical protein
MAIEKELLDQLLAGRDPNEVFAKDGLLDDLKKALSERILNAELDEHLDGERVEGGPNRRKGYSKKSVLTGTSKMTLSIPRDRAGTFDPKLIAKYQRRFPDFGRQDYLYVCAWHERARHPRSSRGALRHRRVGGPDLGGHRCGPGGGRGMAACFGNSRTGFR